MEKKEERIKKGDIVTLSYKLYDAHNNLVDRSQEEQPLVLKYGKTKINKELEKKLMGKKVGDTITIKQRIITKAPTISVDLEDFDDESQQQLEVGQVIELEIGNKTNLFVIEEINQNTSTALLRYKNPYENQTLTNIVKIEKITKEDKN